MAWSRSTRILTMLGAGIALAACSSSKSTGPLAAKLAATFDSLFRADSASASVRAEFDELTLIALNEGATPSSVKLTTDGGLITVDMVGLSVYDTLGGAVADSDLIGFAWTSDFNTELITIAAGSVGPDLVPTHRIGVSGAQLARIRALMGAQAAPHRVSAQSTSSVDAIVFQGPAAQTADSVSLIMTEGAGSGNCTFENEPFRVFAITSASPCTNQTITQTFALHFPPATGISASLAHISLTSSQSVHAPRVLVSG